MKSRDFLELSCMGCLLLVRIDVPRVRGEAFPVDALSATPSFASASFLPNKAFFA
jgi:hypothetical protein